MVFSCFSGKNMPVAQGTVIFDLEKLEFTLTSAQDCVNRLAEGWINLQLKTLREALKNAELARQDPILIMKKIEKLQTQKKNPHHQNETGEL